MKDADLIKKLGGPAQVARLLGMDVPSGTRRVQNWLSRGIPSKVKVDFPHLFMAHVAPKKLRASQVGR